MTSKEKLLFGNFDISTYDNSHIVIAEQKLIVPDKKLILLDQMNEEETKKIKSLGYKGGLII